MSSPPPNVRQDAFISYNHDNNLLRDQDGNGWVDNFHQHLEVHLLQFTGRKVAIWRDPQLPGNVVIAKDLKDRLKGADALIAILSPGYLSSKWCMSELREFCTLAEATMGGGLRPNGKSRVFVVVKIPPDGDPYPPEIADQNRYEFFEINRKTRRPDEYRCDIRNRDERYWIKLEEVAWDLKELLKETGHLGRAVEAEVNLLADRLPEPPTCSDDTVVKPKKTIYLAETTADLAEQRRQIEQELMLNGYNVLPREPLPYVLEDYSKAVKKNLAEAEVSINLLGRTYGLIPDGGTDQSVLRLQLEFAEECAKARSGFKRLIWMPEGLEPSDDKMKRLLQQLREVADPYKGIEFLQTSLEEFKTLMHKRLTVSTNGHAGKALTTAAPVGPRKIYLVCDSRDIANAKPLTDYLQKQRGYEVVLPEFEEVEGEISLAELHLQALLECDAVIVYWGHGSSRWVHAKKSDIEKHAGLEKTEDSPRIRPLRAKAFYVTQPFHDLKDVFHPPTAKVITNFGDFDPALLDDFIRDLEGGNDDKGGNDNVR